MRSRLVEGGLTAAGLLVILLALTAGAAQAQSLEYPIKANYLVRFAAFVDWPNTAFAHAGSPIVICVAGVDPFGSSLDRAVAGQSARGRTIVARRLPPRTAVTGCHIVYVGRTTAAAGVGLSTFGGPGVLTVTDEAVSPTRGAIQFVLSQSRVRFHVDQSASARSGLTISSRLLNLALSVRGVR